MFTPGAERGGVGAPTPPPTTPASYSSASARVAAARRRSGLFTSGARHSPFGTPGRSTPLNRSLQTSQLLEAAGQYTMEFYGSSLPTLVKEALTFVDRNVEMSAVLSEEGWAWLVCGRRLLVWKYRQEESRSRLVNHQFRELTLPPSDLAHRAQLVVVYTPAEGQVPSCIAASPEGFVRYWGTITHEASYCEVSTELQGQECESLVSLGAGLGCLLATTTSTTLLLQPGGGLGGGQTINVRHLKAPAGLLGGISRRVSSLMFGSMPTQAPEARLVRAVGVPGAQGEERAILVLSANSLQKWYLAPGQADQLVYECNVEKHIRESFVDHVWGRERAGATQLRVWLVDMQPAAGGSAVMVLTAAVNPQVSQQLVYALATMETGGSSPPTTVNNFSVLKHSEYYQESAENVLLAQRFLLCGTTAYIYNKNTVLCVSAVGEGDSGDRVEFSGAGDSILGVGRSQRLPLFFSTTNGIVSITPTAANTSTLGGMVNESMTEEASRLTEGLNLSLGGWAEGADQDKTTRFQAAFLHYNKGNVAQSQLLLDELFPGSDTSQLDSAVLQLSINLLDDTPATDPRWAEAMKGPMGGTAAPTSLIVLNQLKDKTTAHQYFISFLQQMGLWQQLSVGMERDTRVATRTALAEHGQRLAFATALRNMHNEHQELVDAAIRHVVGERGEVPKNKLTHADLFYRRVSKIEDIISGVLKAQGEVLSADVAPRDPVATIHNVNKLLLSLLHTTRTPSPTVPPSTTATDSPLEHVPWTATRGMKGTRTLLLQQHQTTVQVGLVRAEDSATRTRLYSQLVNLADFILADYQPHLRSLAALPLGHDAHQDLLKEYGKDRYSLIQPLVEGEQYDQAVSLAEKYCDFRTLVEVCDRTNNQERLTQYMNRFGSEGFSDFVFRWYLETGKRGKLLCQGGGQQGGELARFLQDYSSLAWLHQINTRDFASACSTLRHLAQEESTYLSRKKTLLSLSKLCGLVAGGGDGGGGADTTNGSIVVEDDSLSLEEELIHYQEQLPESVLSAHFLDADTMRVLSPTELIHMYTSEDNVSANEFDFKKALDLLSFVGEEESEELRRLVWVRALLRNSWEHLDTDNPIQALSETAFFKTVELAFTQGCEMRELLVPVEELMACEELEKLCQDANFKFLIRAGYEHVEKLIG